jgi:hypothetical protein
MLSLGASGTAERASCARALNKSRAEQRGAKVWWRRIRKTGKSWYRGKEENGINIYLFIL